MDNCSELACGDPETRHGVDYLLCFAFHPRQQLFTRWDVLDQSHASTNRPNAVFWVAKLVDFAAALSTDEVAQLLELRSAWPFLQSNNLGGYIVLEHARRVLQRAENVRRVQFTARNNRLLDCLVDRAATRFSATDMKSQKHSPLDCAHEASTCRGS